MRYFFGVGLGVLALGMVGYLRVPATQPISTLWADEIAETLNGTTSRSPVDLVLGPAGQWLVTANQTSGTLSLVDLNSQMVVDELPCGPHPSGLDLCLDQQHVVVSCSHSGEVQVVEVAGSTLRLKHTIAVGGEPLGLTVSPDGKIAFVGLVATGEIAQLDLAAGRLVRKVAVGAWPRYLALAPDGSRLAVACSGEGKIVVIDSSEGEVLYEERIVGAINMGHLTCSQDGKYVYFPYMVYRSNPITRGNIQRGWVLASRIGRVRLDGPAYREAISLDEAGRAVADPHGLELSGDETRLVVSASGTHELLVYRRPDLPFIGVGGPSDLIDPSLLADDDLFYRIDLGGRPMGLAMAADERTVYVANYLKDCVQVVDIRRRQVVRQIPLTDRPARSLARRGAEIFYDATHSLDQWYSCHTCHYDGGVNSRPMDTLNDGSPLTMKTVLPLQHVSETGPWTWHGWQEDLAESVQNSFTTTMQGSELPAEELEAFLAFLESNSLPPNPFRKADGSLGEAARRGQAVFESEAAGCATCHSGPAFTDGQIHDVGLGSEADEYEGFNTPSLRGVYRRVRLLHDGRAKSLEEVLTGDHAPEKVAGTRNLTPEELSDLVEYLNSL